jgi:hypothetical protein
MTMVPSFGAAVEKRPAEGRAVDYEGRIKSVVSVKFCNLEAWYPQYRLQVATRRENPRQLPFVLLQEVHIGMLGCLNRVLVKFDPRARISRGQLASFGNFFCNASSNLPLPPVKGQKC